MERLSGQVRTLLGPPERTESFRRYHAEAEELKREAIDPKDFSPLAKIPVKIQVLLQAGLRRLLDLTDAFIRDANAGQLAPAFVNARAAMETAMLVFDVTFRASDVLKARDKAALTALDEVVMKGLLVSKSDGWGSAELQAPNVLTVIQRWAKTAPKIESLYADLSEHAHPNLACTAGAYSMIEPTTGRTLFLERSLHSRPEKLHLPLSVVEAALRLTITAHKSYEQMLPAFVSLCEESIHYRGT